MTTINKFRKNIWILAVGLVLGSCSKVNEQNPYVNVDPADVFKTPARVELAAIGMYDALQNAEFLGGRVLIYADQRGNDANIASFFGNTGSFTLLSGDAIPLNCWTGGYRTIFETNFFTKKLKQNESVVGSTKALQYYAEAKFIRALCYFYLVNLYAQPYSFTADASHAGVPLILDAVTDGQGALSSANNVKRNTVKEVYDQMIADLTDASNNLPITYNDIYQDRARATKAAADGLLARVYLYKGDWANANARADAVIASPRNFSLSAEPIDVFKFDNQTSPSMNEKIFSVAMNTADNPNTNNAIGQHYSPNGRGDISINPAYFNIPNFGATDKRKIAPMIRVVGGASWTGKYFNNTYENWVPILRLAEIKLIKAEALARMSTIVDPVAYNQLLDIRVRSNASTLVPPTTKQGLIDLIMNERRIELAFEGQGLFDFLRTGRDVPARLPVQPIQTWGSNFVVFPIPFVDWQRSGGVLVQNPGY